MIEIKRVLDKDGVCTILETTTPADFSRLIDLLKKEGFEIDKVIRPNVGHGIFGYQSRDIEWEKVIAPFKKKPIAYGASSFLIYIKKRIEPQRNESVKPL